MCVRESARYREKERQTGRKRDRQRERERKKEKERESYDKGGYEIERRGGRESGGENEIYVVV